MGFFIYMLMVKYKYINCMCCKSIFKVRKFDVERILEWWLIFCGQNESLYIVSRCQINSFVLMAIENGLIDMSRHWPMLKSTNI